MVVGGGEYSAEERDKMLDIY
jgi:hypothetical protein